MKKTDLKRLEKALEHYDKVVQLLVQAEESIWKNGTERFSTGESTLTQVKQMARSAIEEKEYLAGKINAYKELYFK